MSTERHHSAGVRAILDVSTLPHGAVGPRAPLWWGTFGLILIESTVMALGIATYFYLRMRFTEWPPADAGPPSLLLPTINVLVLGCAALPQVFIDRHIQQDNRRQLQVLLAVSALFSLTACILRVWDFKALNCDWNEHAYGSITWALVGFHSTHLYASTVENLLMAWAISEVPLDAKHRLDLNVNGIYWYFVFTAWVIIYAVIWWAGRAL